MSNLLKKASVVLVPTAYNDGTLLSAKPKDGSGDFDFSRNSSATRVNAQGLVEDVQILSGDLVQNGDFSEEGAEEVSNGSFTNGSTDWTLGTGWSIAEDKASKVSGVTSYLLQPMVLPTPNTYKVTFTVIDYVSGDVKWGFSSTASSPFGTPRTANGTYTEYFTHDINTIALRFRASSTFEGSITNISVKEVGQNWSFGDGFTPDQVNSKATCDGTQTAATNLQQTITTNIQNQLVRVSFTLDYTAGLLLGSLSGTGAVDFTNITSSGTYTAEMTSNEVSPILTLQGDASFIGSITNVIIKSVTNDTNLPRINYENFSYQDALGSEEIVNGDFANGSTDWALESGWSIGDNKLTYQDSNNGVFARQLNVFNGISLSTYKISFKVIDTATVLDIAFFIGNALLIAKNSYVDGTYSFTVTANSTNTDLRIYGYTTGGLGSIDNVSVKEYLGQEVVPDSGCGHLLFEPQSTNLAPYSESLVNWLNSGGNTLTSGLTSPSGDNSAYSILSGTGTSSRLVLITNLVALETKHTLSAFVKQVDGFNTAYLRWSSSELAANIVTFAFDTETLTNVSGNTTDLFVETFQNGWYRIGFTFTTGTSITNQAIQINRGASVTASYWGAMLEAQSYATSYIPTEGTTKTRNQDFCNNGGDVSLISSTEGTLYAEIAALADSTTQRYITLSDGTSANDVRLYLSSGGHISVLSKVGGITQVYLQSNAYPQTDFNKVAFKYKENDFALWINGTEVDTDTSGLVNAPNTFNELAFDGNGLKFFGKTKCVAVWKEALSDTELTELTTL